MCLYGTDRPSAPEPVCERTGTARQRLVRYGPQSLSSSELVAYLIRTGGRDGAPDTLAAKLLERRGGVRGLAGATVREMRAVRGMGASQAALIAVSVELGRRVAARVVEMDPVISGPQDVADLLLPRVCGQQKEHFLSVLLDTKNRVVAVHTVSVGSLDSSIVHPREVFRDAVAASAAGVIVAHNHPSGDPSPSNEDRQVTARLAEAARVLGIDLLDHLVLGDDRWVSFRQDGLL